MIDPAALTYSAEQRAAALARVNWPESTRAKALAISLAELGEMQPAGVRTSINERPGIERSWGPWQINLEAHPHVSTHCATDLECSTREALRISGGGVNFWPWGAFSSGNWTGFLGRAREVLDGGTASPPRDPNPPGGWVPDLDLPRLPQPGDNTRNLPGEAVGAVAREITKGAEQLAVAAGVIGIAALLGYTGLRRVLG